MGETHVNNFLTTLNIPGIHHKTLKRREREASAGIEKVAKRLCTEALVVEKECESDSVIGVSFDGA